MRKKSILIESRYSPTLSHSCDLEKETEAKSMKKRPKIFFFDIFLDKKFVKKQNLKVQLNYNFT